MPELTADQVAREEKAFVEQGVMLEEIERLVQGTRDRELAKVPLEWK